MASSQVDRLHRAMSCFYSQMIAYFSQIVSSSLHSQTKNEWKSIVFVDFLSHCLYLYRIDILIFLDYSNCCNMRTTGSAEDSSRLQSSIFSVSKNNFHCIDHLHSFIIVSFPFPPLFIFARFFHHSPCISVLLSLDDALSTLFVLDSTNTIEQRLQ